MTKISVTTCCLPRWSAVLDQRRQLATALLQPTTTTSDATVFGDTRPDFAFGRNSTLRYRPYSAWQLAHSIRSLFCFRDSFVRACDSRPILELTVSHARRTPRCKVVVFASSGGFASNRGLLGDVMLAVDGSRLCCVVGLSADVVVSMVGALYRDTKIAENRSNDSGVGWCSSLREEIRHHFLLL